MMPTTFWGTIVRPRPTFEAFERDGYAGRRGALVLLAVCLVYTAILGVFIARGYPAAFRSVLGLPEEDQYRVQIWYQAPLFFASTAVTAAALVLITRSAGLRLPYPVAFARVAFATAVPFALTTMVVESVIAVLLALGLLQPDATLQWLLGPGSWFAALYQYLGLVWLAVLLVLAVRAGGFRSWWTTVGVTVTLIAIYAWPIALFIR